VNAEELEAAIGARDKSMVIDFFATWCGPCLLLAKELEKVADDLGDKVDILKLDVEENPDLAARLQIQGLPTMLFIGMDPQKPALRTEGLLPADTIKNILQKEL
jgi:thioredoxin